MTGLDQVAGIGDTGGFEALEESGGLDVGHGVLLRSVAGKGGVVVRPSISGEEDQREQVQGFGGYADREWPCDAHASTNARE